MTATIAKREPIAAPLPVDDDEADADSIPAAQVLLWYAGLRHHTLSHYVPLSVLLVAHVAAGASRRVTFARLYELVPRAVVNASIWHLKNLGFIETDGVVITIRRLPAP